jgi:hypothetical protein
VTEYGDAGVAALPGTVMTTAFVRKTKGGRRGNGCNSVGTELITVQAAFDHFNGHFLYIACNYAEQLFKI